MKLFVWVLVFLGTAFTLDGCASTLTEDPTDYHFVCNGSASPYPDTMSGYGQNFNQCR